MIHPYLAYCNLVWASKLRPNYQARLKRLTVLQNRAIRVIIGCFNASFSTETLYIKQLRILKIGQITALQVNEFMYKHYNNLLPSIFSDYFTIISQVNPYDFRSSNNYMYRSIYSRINTRMFSIKCVGPNAWNLIPFDLQLLPNRSSFKRNLRNYLLD